MCSSDLHGQTVGGAILHTVATKNTNPKIDRIVAQFLLLRGLVHNPIDHRQVDRTNADTHLASDTLIKLVMNATAITL